MNPTHRTDSTPTIENRVVGTAGVAPCRRLVPVAVMAMVVLTCGACGGPPDVAAPFPLDRFIPVERSDEFKLDEVLELELVDEWRPAAATTTGGWQLQPATDPSAPLVLTREPAAATGTVDLIELVANDLGRTEIQLDWGTSDATDDGDNHGLTAKPGERVDAGHKRYLLPVSSHPTWPGVPGRLRLTIHPQRGTEPRIDAIRLFRASLDPSRLAAAVAQPWKVALANDLRNALLCTPEHAVQYTVTVPTGGQFRAAFALLGTPAAEVDYRVRLIPATGGPTEIIGGSFAADGSAAGWRELSADLDQYAGQSVTLSLEVEADRFDAAHGLALWAHPEVFAPAAAPPPSVVLISIDTLRADRVSAYGYHRQTTPNLDAWIHDHGVVFSDTVAPAPWTLPSHVSLMTGLDAQHHGVNHTSPAPTGLHMLAESFRDQGYATIAITGGGFVHPQWGFAQGFDSYRSFAESMGFSDELETNLQQALAVVEANAGRPVFLFFHTYEVHNPYIVRQPYYTQFTGFDRCPYYIRIEHAEREPGDGFRDGRVGQLLKGGHEISWDELPPERGDVLSDLYDAGVAYTDHELARLLEALSGPGWADRTIVVVTSDHGEMLGEHGLITHFSLYEENLKVPLMIAAPDRIGAATTIAQQVRLVDVPATILELAQLPPLATSDGVSLAPLMRGRTAAVPTDALSYAPGSNFGLSVRRSGRFKYVFHNVAWPSPEAPAEEFFDLMNDPREVAAGDLSSTAAVELAAVSRQALDDTVPGLYFHFTNHQSEPFVAELRAPAPFKATLKIADPAAPRFVYQSAVFAWVTVPPAADFVAWVENPAHAAYTVVLRNDTPAATFSLEIPPPAAAAVPVQLVRLVADGWETVTGAEAGTQATGVAVSWRRLDATDDPGDDEIDSELRKQLEALGYVQN